ncbi:MAG: FecR domain-containing protein [Bdellovibrionales bacterium]|nr:FecR domain-containing protein [Bdellovibrionales bacterium]
MSTWDLKKIVTFVSIIFFGLTLLFEEGYAAGRAGSIVSFENDVEIFVNPSKTPFSGKNQVKFNDKYYRSKKAKIGYRLDWKDVVKTGPEGKVKIAFQNGDSISISPGTAYFLDNSSANPQKTEKKSGVLNLLYGKARAVISKKGPRNNLKIKTKSSVAGVRGTDFVVSYQPKEAKTELFVLRGAVEVAPTGTKTKSVTVKKGQVAEIKKESYVQKQQTENKDSGIETHIDEQPKKMEVKSITKENLVEIQKDSQVNVDKGQMKDVPQEVVQEVKQMEQACANVVLEDIKADDKVLYEKIMQEKESKKIDIMSADTLNSVVVGKLFKEAPKAKVKHKMQESDMKDLVDEDVYKKYFKYE